MTAQLSSKPDSEKRYQKYAWVILFTVGFLGAIASYPFLQGIEPSPEYFKSMTGVTWDNFIDSGHYTERYIHDALKLTGVLFIGLCILIMAISATAFRKGERWAWAVLWYFPIMLGWVTWLLYVDSGNDWSSWVTHFVLTVMCVLGLLLPVRRFFPAQE
jgi:hypothetical protein